jgi:hypothetical protein
MTARCLTGLESFRQPDSSAARAPYRTIVLSITARSDAPERGLAHPVLMDATVAYYANFSVVAGCHNHL